MNERTLFPDTNDYFEVIKLNEFLEWCRDEGVSDIKFEGNKPVRVYVDGSAHAVTAYKLADHNLREILDKLYGNTGTAVLANCSALDFSYQLQLCRDTQLRFRGNAVSTLSGGEETFEITLRLLPQSVPDFTSLGVEQPLRDALMQKKGLTFVTGETGQGKTTLLAATIHQLLYTHCGEILSFENPIEFTYDDLEQDDSWVSQTEIPTHLPTFHDALVVAMRRYPQIIVVGECRDKQTIEAAIHAAQQGSAVYSTTHTKNVTTTIDRLINVFPGSEQEMRAVDILQMLNVIISQQLVPSPAVGASPAVGRTALREWLHFDEALVDELIKTPKSKWRFVINDAFSDLGQTMEQAALIAYDEQTISEETLLSILPPPSPGRSGRTARGGSGSAGEGLSNGTATPLGVFK